MAEYAEIIAKNALNVSVFMFFHVLFFLFF